MEIPLKSPVTDRIKLPRDTDANTHNGPLKTGHAGHCTCRRDYSDDTDRRSHQTSFRTARNANKLYRPTSMPSVHNIHGTTGTTTSSGKSTSRRTTLISKTKYHYVKMTGGDYPQETLLMEEIYPRFNINNLRIKSKSSESIAAMDSEDSSSQSSGIYDKRLSIVSALSHSDYETCGSQTSLDDYENDRISVCSGGLKDDNSFSSNSVKSSASQSDGQTSRPLSSVLGDSELEELDYSEVEDTTTRPEEGRRRHERTCAPKPERPAILDQGMTATVAWLRSELMEIRKMDQALIGQFMNIQGKIRTLKTQQQQKYKQNLALRKQSLLTGEHPSELLGSNRVSWELDSLYEEDEYYDYDTEDDLDEEDGDSTTLGASGYS